MCFENKLRQNPDLFKIVNDKLEDYISKGSSWKLLNDEIAHVPKMWYLPGFTVCNSRDAASKYEGVYLNFITCSIFERRVL